MMKKIYILTSSTGKVSRSEKDSELLNFLPGLKRTEIRTLIRTAEQKGNQRIEFSFMETEYSLSFIFVEPDTKSQLHLF